MQFKASCRVEPEGELQVQYIVPTIGSLLDLISSWLPAAFNMWNPNIAQCFVCHVLHSSPHCLGLLRSGIELIYKVGELPLPIMQTCFCWTKGSRTLISMPGKPEGKYSVCSNVEHRARQDELQPSTIFSSNDSTYNSSNRTWKSRVSLHFLPPLI